MAAFIEDLWTSIFTPGPTSTLLLATNVSFAALQSILLALLIATYSIHFVVLSILSAGLWAAINWFAREVMITQAQQEESKSAAGGVESSKRSGKTERTALVGEVEVIGPVELPADSIQPRQTRASTRVDEGSSTSSVTVGQEAWNTGAVPQGNDALQQRRGMSESTGELSTDGEWEKVEGER